MALAARRYAGGPTKKYDTNINFLVASKYQEALDLAAEQQNVRRSDIMRGIVEDWYEANGFDQAEIAA